MEKITTVVFHRKKERFLSSLQDLGVIHIALDACDVSHEVLATMHKKIERCHAFLAEAKKIKQKLPSKFSTTPVDNRDAFFFVESYETLTNEFAQVDEDIKRAKHELDALAIWGEFDVTTIQKLRTEGIGTRFFISSLKKFNALALNDIHYVEIARTSAHVYFVVFERSERVQLPCEEFIYPDTDRRKLQKGHEELLVVQKEKQSALQALFGHAREVTVYCDALQTRYAYSTINQNASSAAANTIYVFNGWLPRAKKKSVEQFLEQQDVYFYFSKPQPDEAVPTLLRNNRFSRLFEPITRLFDLPRYTEFDLTPFFAPFFTLFFGFCLGDAGYGLILGILAFVLRKKFTGNKKSIASLLLILGISTFFCGLISGTMFGADLTNIHGIDKIVLLNQDQLFTAALVIGVIQVLFGMCVKAVSRMRQFGFLSGVSTIGWIILLCGIIGIASQKTGPSLMYVGIALILFFNDIKANIFVRIGKGLWELYGITGVFGDVLSYIRLFALGISSSILGFVVNEIALQFRGIPFIGFIITLFVLVVGHTGNLALSALSSFVHPLRLTFVEFYKSAGFQGGGKAYNPFRKITTHETMIS